MKKRLPSSNHFLLSLLEILDSKFNYGEITFVEFEKQKTLILEHLDSIVKEKDFNGSTILSSNELITLTINNSNN